MLSLSCISFCGTARAYNEPESAVTCIPVDPHPAVVGTPSPLLLVCSRISRILALVVSAVCPAHPGNTPETLLPKELVKLFRHAIQGRRCFPNRPQLKHIDRRTARDERVEHNNCATRGPPTCRTFATHLARPNGLFGGTRHDVSALRNCNNAPVNRQPSTDSAALPELKDQQAGRLRGAS